MNVRFNKNSIATITMSVEEFGVIRYALAHGVQKLADTASFLKRLNPEEYVGMQSIAAKAKSASDELEAATQRHCHKVVGSKDSAPDGVLAILAGDEQSSGGQDTTKQ